MATKRPISQGPPERIDFSGSCIRQPLPAVIGVHPHDGRAIELDKLPPHVQGSREENGSGGSALQTVHTLSLEDLLRLVAHGSAAALRMVYQAEGGRLYAIALRIVRRPEVAADVLQDAFLQIWRKADAFDPARGSAAAWVTGIVRYRALDAARRRRREVLVEAPPEAAADEPDPLELLDIVQSAAKLRRCLSQLQERNRRCIVLAFVDGLSHSQIAARLELPLGTVKAWVRRGLAALRSCLES